MTHNKLHPAVKYTMRELRKGFMAHSLSVDEGAKKVSALLADMETRKDALSQAERFLNHPLRPFREYTAGVLYKTQDEGAIDLIRRRLDKEDNGDALALMSELLLRNGRKDHMHGATAARIRKAWFDLEKSRAQLKELYPMLYKSLAEHS